VPDVSCAPVLDPSSQPSTCLTYSTLGELPINVRAFEPKPLPAKSLMVPAPPWSVAISLIYVAGLIGTGIYLFISLVLTN
jgi:hypothetical protein